VLYTAIAVCEVAFWGFLVAGLGARYLLHRRRTSLVLLLGSPAVDLLLLLLVAIDLQRGATPTQAHALAALYLGVSVAFGTSIVHWADRQVARRFAGGPPVTDPPRGSRHRAHREWRDFRTAVLAWAVTCALLLGMSVVAGDRDRAQPLLAFAGMLTIGVVVWFIIGPVRATLAVRRRTGRTDHPPRETTARRDSSPAPTGGDGSARSAPAASMRPWAPWWVYVGVILGVNYLRQLVMPVGTVPEWMVVLIVLALSAALFVASTAVYRAVGRH
jgi:hypothetical protein